MGQNYDNASELKKIRFIKPGATKIYIKCDGAGGHVPKMVYFLEDSGSFCLIKMDNGMWRDRIWLLRPLWYRILFFFPHNLYELIMCELEYYFAAPCGWCGRQYFSSKNVKACCAEKKRTMGRGLYDNTMPHGGGGGGSVSYDSYSDSYIDSYGQTYTKD